MSSFQIKLYGDPLLRETSKKLLEIKDDSKDLVKGMAETMFAAEGVGLAAPQIGVLKRLIVLDMGDEDFVAYVNPEITEYSEKEDMDEEGCLCLPEIRVPVKRSLKIRFKATDLQGREVEFEASDFLARILQHEIDHLNGKTILENTSSEDKDKAIRRLMEIYEELRLEG